MANSNNIWLAFDHCCCLLRFALVSYLLSLLGGIWTTQGKKPVREKSRSWRKYMLFFSCFAQCQKRRTHNSFTTWNGQSINNFCKKLNTQLERAWKELSNGVLILALWLFFEYIIKITCPILGQKNDVLTIITQEYVILQVTIIHLFLLLLTIIWKLTHRWKALFNIFPTVCFI